MAPKVTQEHLDARRRQILHAAIACFAKNGFHRTTMQEVCEAAELSPGAVYNYFDGKAEIIETLADESLRKSAALFDELDRQGDTSRALDALARVLGEMLESPEAGVWLPMKIALWGEAFRSAEIKELLDRSYEASIERLARVIREGQARGEVLESLDPTSAARLLVSVVEGLSLQKAIDPKLDVTDYWHAFRAIIDGWFWDGSW